MPTRRIRWGWVAVAALPALFLTYFFAYPLGRILSLGLSEMSIGSTGLQSRLVSVGWFTLWQATLSTVLTFIFAAPMTWAVGRYEFRGRKLAMALVTVPFVLPTVVVGTAFVALGWRESIGAILAAHVFFNVAVVVRTVGSQWRRLDPDLLNAAATLGASPLEVMRRVTLPLLRPSLAAAASIVFLFTFTSFGVILILGGFTFATLEVEIYRQAIVLFDLPLAAALAVIQLVGVSLALYLYSRYQERHSASWELASEDAVPRPAGRARIGVYGSIIGTLAVLAIPLAVLLTRSLGSFDDLFAADLIVGSPVEAIRNSLLTAVAATAIALVIGIMAATFVSHRSGTLSRWFDTTLMLPLGTSAVAIGLGFIVALDWPVDLRASLALVPIAHALVAIPFVVRIVLPTMRSIDPDLRHAAATLGAKPISVWRRVDLPLVSRAALVAAGFSVVISLGEFGATTFVARPNTATIPTLIFRLLSRPGPASFGTAMALSIVLAALTAAVILWVDRFRVGDIGSF
ncbi:MAG: iron ABC transporter permease [Actinobacteria bacterium]|nr:MAG: iron ABC transporter permease [Actinomycetota bacterium]REK37451.1 MAG: iron ABC transporter permease [Actinomycetota bacterium]